jgi:hypothetical protein
MDPVAKRGSIFGSRKNGCKIAELVPQLPKVLMTSGANKNGNLPIAKTEQSKRL